jgi:tetratricopeptide (TPR) repeat protein
LTVLAALVLSCSDDVVEKGDIALRLGDWKMAMEFYYQALRRDPADAAARLGMGKALLQKAVALPNDTTSWREALVHLEAAHTIAPSAGIAPLLSEAWSSHARNLLAGRDTVQALSALSRAIELDSRSVEPVNLAGIVYFRLGHEDKALQLFGKAIAIDSTNSSAHFNLGMAKWQREQFSEAHRHWLTALANAPEDEDILYWFALSEKRIREGGE